MADALLSPAVGGVMQVVSCGLIAHSVRSVKSHFSERRIPLMGVAGAFVFAAQMVNFSIPGTGSSGHIGGGLLLAALLGPAPAFLVMASLLLVQALFFADGGLLAFGCNLFNMGFFSCFLVYPFLFRPLAGSGKSRARLMMASVVSGMVSMELGALSVTIQTLLSGVTQLPFSAFVMAMLPIHLAIGLGEGLATGAVLAFVYRNLPDAESVRLESRRSPGFVAWSLGLAAAMVGGGLSLLASGRPDGLEWSMERVAGSAELPASGAVHSFFAKLSEWCAVLPDYAFPGEEGWIGTTVSGLAGAAVCLFIGMGLCRLLRRKELTAK